MHVITFHFTVNISHLFLMLQAYLVLVRSTPVVEFASLSAVVKRNKFPMVIDNLVAVLFSLFDMITLK